MNKKLLSESKKKIFIFIRFHLLLSKIHWYIEIDPEEYRLQESMKQQYREKPIESFRMKINNIWCQFINIRFSKTNISFAILIVG